MLKIEDVVNEFVTPQISLKEYFK